MPDFPSISDDCESDVDAIESEKSELPTLSYEFDNKLD
jgi:hypothetical protein